MKHKIKLTAITFILILFSVGCTNTKSTENDVSKNKNTSTQTELKAVQNETQSKVSAAGKSLDAKIDVEYTFSKGQLSLTCKSNLPDNMPFYIKILDSATAKIIKEEFTSKRLANGEFKVSYLDIKQGDYIIQLISPTIPILDASLKSVLGAAGENLTGSIIQTDNSGSKKIVYEQQITLN